ncbi:MAG: hypothetical protein DYG90_00750 [Chloroflexi bacterium CFX6]|nr:hypothetical protein [Chloroflexi bacterium CFX6]
MIDLAIRVTLPDGRRATLHQQIAPAEIQASPTGAWHVALMMRLARVLADVRECVTPGSWLYRDPAATIAGEPLTAAGKGDSW